MPIQLRFPMRRILYVDDDRDVGLELRNKLEEVPDDWQVVLVDTPDVAFTQLSKTPFNVVVSRLDGDLVDAAEVLARVRRDHPDVLRALISDGGDPERERQDGGDAHQLLHPSDAPERLRMTLSNACRLHDLINCRRTRQMVHGMHSIPSLPVLYTQFVEAMRNPNTTIEGLGNIIGKDIGMSAKVLQIVNSPVFGLRERISSPGQAATFLGMDTLRSLVLSVGVFSQFDAKNMKHVPIEQVWDHSMRVTAYARAIMEVEGADQRSFDEAMTAGMMHDIGKLVQASNHPNRVTAVNALAARDGQDPLDLETRVFGQSHAVLGACLLERWGLPTSVVQAVAFHHRPSDVGQRRFSALTALHVADRFSHTDLSQESPIVFGLDRRHLIATRRIAKLRDWVEACRKALARD